MTFQNGREIMQIENPTPTKIKLRALWAVLRSKSYVVMSGPHTGRTLFYQGASPESMLVDAELLKMTAGMDAQRDAAERLVSGKH